MAHLKKTWVRVLVSLLAAGVVAEILDIINGEPKMASSTVRHWILRAIIYFVLTKIIYYKPKEKDNDIESIGEE